ncbi:MAG: hypothetical protein KF764_31920 [Labilithrix sp.]|nr:hypothetical protein [Labilithrix sp.]MBX3224689.1 hypothetical protein [Labilithrix sp.]
MTKNDDDIVSWPKQCRGCGASYEEESWRELPFVGVDHAYRLEFRNCPCGSTLAVPLEPG